MTHHNSADQKRAGDRLNRKREKKLNACVWQIYSTAIFGARNIGFYENCLGYANTIYAHNAEHVIDNRQLVAEAAKHT